MARDDSINLKGVVGPRAGADSADFDLRLDKTGAIVSQNAHGWWHESVSRGNVYVASIPVAGVAPGTALTTLPPFALWNPTASKYDLSILGVYLGYVSGTLGQGSLVYADVAQPAAPTGGTELVTKNLLIGGGRSTARAWTLATVASTPSLLRPSFLIGAVSAATNSMPALCYEETSGGIVVPPGQLLAMQGVTAAGSSPLILLSVVFEEVQRS